MGGLRGQGRGPLSLGNSNPGAGCFTVKVGGQRSGQVSVVRWGLTCAMSRVSLPFRKHTVSHVKKTQYVFRVGSCEPQVAQSGMCLLFRPPPPSPGPLAEGVEDKR